MERVLEAPRPSPFLTPAFLQPWVKSFAGPLRLGCWKDRGLIFFHQNGSAWELLGGQEVADRLDGLCREEEFWLSLRQEVQNWEGEIVFPNLAEDSSLFLHRQPQDRLEVTDQSPYVGLPGSFEDYLQGLDKKARHELQRKMRRAERLAQVGLRVTHEGDHLPEFLRLHRLSSSAKAEFMSERAEAFFRDLAHHLQAQQMFRLSVLWDGSVALAAMLQIRFHNILHLYNSGYDPQQSALAPGLVLLGHCLQQACQEGIQEFDFLRGQERYKYDLGGVDRPVYRLTWSRA